MFRMAAWETLSPATALDRWGCISEMAEDMDMLPQWHATNCYYINNYINIINLLAACTTELQVFDVSWA